MLNVLSKQYQSHKNTENSCLIRQLIQEMKGINDRSEKQAMISKEWFAIINSLSISGDIDAMINEYNSMISCGVELNPYILTSIFEGIINNGKPKYLEIIWNDWMHKYININHNSIECLSKIIDCRVIQSLIIATYKMEKYYQFQNN